MLLETIFAPFVQERPICVMARAVLERLLDAQRIDDLFAHTAQRQYTRDLLFSSLVQLMSEVVLGVHPAVHAAYQAHQETIGGQPPPSTINWIESKQVSLLPWCATLPHSPSR